MIADKKKKCIFFLIFAGVLIMMAVSLFIGKYCNRSNEEVIFRNTANNLGVLSNGDLIVQEFEIQEADEVQIGLYCATYINTENNYGYLNIVCENSNGEVLQSEVLDIHSIQDNSNVYITFDGTRVNDGMVIIKVFPEYMNEGTTLTLYTTDYDDTEYAMTFNDNIQTNEIALVAEYRSSSNVLLGSFLFGISVILFIQCFYFFVNQILIENAYQTYIRYSMHIVFFVLSLIWIIVYNDGGYLAENCIVKIEIVMLVDILSHYIYAQKKEDSFYKKVLGMIIIAGVTLPCAFGIAYILFISNITPNYSKIMVSFIAGLLIIIGLIILYTKKIIKEELLLTLIVFVTGSVFSISYPISSGSSWDDQIHYARSVSLSHVLDHEISMADSLLINNALSGGAPKLLQDGNVEIFKNQVIEAARSHEMTDYTGDEIQIGALISYLPEAIMLFIGRGLGLSYQYIFVLGRWADVVLYSILIFYSMKRIKSGKLIIFTISMFPTTLFLMSNYSYDTWGIGFSILAFSHYIGILQDDSRLITLKDIVMICVLLIIGFSAKPIYFCMTLLLLFVKRDKIKKEHRKAYYIIVVLATMLIAASFIIPYLTAGTGGNDMRGGEDVNSTGQIHFILSKPMEYMAILMKFLWRYWSLKNASGYMIDMAYLGRVSYFLPYIILSLFVILLDKSEEDLNAIHLMGRIGTFLMAFITSMWVATALYIAYNPVGADSIAGCQARYLLPLLLMVAYYISDYRIVKYIRKFISQRMLVITASIGMTVYALFAIYTRCISLY